MTRRLVFAANWKMHHDPKAAAAFALRFVERAPARPGRDLWFFPPAVSIAATVDGFAGRTDISVGAQNVYWEAKGAFTGEISAGMVQGCGGSGALVGHSERRHVFGETDAETARKVKALLAQHLTPMLCVGEKLAERESGHTGDVVLRQLRAVLTELAPIEAAGLLVAYEPVWAIGTGRVARPQDAAEVHQLIRDAFREHRVPGRVPVLYGGSVSTANAEGLLAEPEIDGVLVGGASLDPDTWAALVGTDASVVASSPGAD